MFCSVIPQPQPILTMTNIITDPSMIEFASLFPAHLTEPKHVWDLRVSTSLAHMPEGDAYTHGVRLHALLNRIKDHEPLCAQERSYLPFLDALRTELRLHGVSFLHPEQKLAHPLVGNGRCDILLEGGLAPKGVCEMKCTTTLPDEVRIDDLNQLGRYGVMLGVADSRTWLWGCVAYVSVPSRAIRIFAYSNLRHISRCVVSALAA